MLSAKYLTAIFLIVAAAAAGWFVLGGTLVVRTDQSDTAQRAALAAQWGTALEQSQPSFTLQTRHGKSVTDFDLDPASSRIAVDLALDLRRKGLLWYNTYGVGFTATYGVGIVQRGTLRMLFPMPSTTATYDDVSVSVNGRRIETTGANGKLAAVIPWSPGRPVSVTVHYRTRGLDTWTYRFGTGVVTAHDVKLTMRTNFKAIDFPAATLAPTAERETPDGWELEWSDRQLVTGAGIGMAFPSPLQPGPLAQRLTFWAPLSLAFYVFVMLVITTLRRIDLHPINYLFLAAAFFAFHLLFAYTVDRIRIEYAFVICSAVSLALTVSYLRLVVGLRFAAVEAAAAQFFYLILFSLALFDEGYSGLSITIGAIVTLFVMMQVTGRIRWSERFSPAPARAT
ncbi:MAG TPA: inner membrane CreD family protein [Candidatus Elarobacter sp.]|nr:inner membrane CreD family protein [Candidatus Elarobacter sp.]